MRFAFKTANEHNSWAEILSVWKEADGIELFEAGWLFDHFYPIRSRPGAPDLTGPCLEGWTMLAALAQATQRLRLGTLVSAMPYRHPAVLANMAATVDIISGGRLNLGIGAGGTSARRPPTGSSWAACASASIASTRVAKCSSACSPKSPPTSTASTTT